MRSKSDDDDDDDDDDDASLGKVITMFGLPQTNAVRANAPKISIAQLDLKKLTHTRSQTAQRCSTFHFPDASTHLFRKMFLSVGPLVCPSVPPSDMN